MKHALILSGGWRGHQPRAMAEIFAGLLRAEGFGVQCATTLSILADSKNLAGLDLIVPNWTMGRLSRKAEGNLLKAVAGGTGCGGCHGGMGDAFRNSTGYQFMVGGQFVAHPGNIKKYTVTLLPGDPITDGLVPFAMRSEQYYMHVDPSNRVLATTVCDGKGAPWTKGTVMPVAWTRYYGQGRVFYSSLGHKPDDFDVPEARELLRRGLLWAARV